MAWPPSGLCSHRNRQISDRRRCGLVRCRLTLSARLLCGHRRHCRLANCLVVELPASYTSLGSSSLPHIANQHQHLRNKASEHFSSVLSSASRLHRGIQKLSVEKMMGVLGRRPQRDQGHAEPLVRDSGTKSRESWILLRIWYSLSFRALTPSMPAGSNCCSSKGSAPYWSNPVFFSDVKWGQILEAKAEAEDKSLRTRTRPRTIFRWRGSRAEKNCVKQIKPLAYLEYV